MHQYEKTTLKEIEQVLESLNKEVKENSSEEQIYKYVDDCPIELKEVIKDTEKFKEYLANSRY